MKLNRHDPNRQDPYFQYLKYGSYFSSGDGNDFSDAGSYQAILLESPEEEGYRQCWERFRQQKDSVAREKLILWNMRTVYTVSKYLVRFPLFSMEMEDLMGSGCVGLIEALDHYDEQGGKEFSNYAFFRIIKRMWGEMEAFGIRRWEYDLKIGRTGSKRKGKKKNKRRRELRRFSKESGEEQYDEIIANLALEQEIRRLDSEQQQILVLLFEENYSQRETARILKLSLYEMRKRLEEIFKILEKNL